MGDMSARAAVVGRRGARGGVFSRNLAKCLTVEHCAEAARVRLARLRGGGGVTGAVVAIGEGCFCDFWRNV